MAQKKERLDRVMVSKGLAASRQKAVAMIMAGNVRVNDLPVHKAGTQIKENDKITVTGNDCPYVSRGGLKLEPGLETFDIQIAGSVCMDVGASTGGFTDCLLQNGAAFVYAVDVGYGQLAWKIRQDKRVAVIERTNIRYMEKEKIDRPVDIAVIDVSFISLKIVMPEILKFLKNQADIIALIKPQFEVGKGKVGKGGVVRDTTLHDEVIESLCLYFDTLNLARKGLLPSPILGPSGNREFLIWLARCNT
ncbi:TlyA family RNA methyltransferase [Desulfobacterales bacterium HSG16]|nr:TlyA family RNA methyltransferase [Desulfobacterales bacterium HSG16]